MTGLRKAILMTMVTACVGCASAKGARIPDALFFFTKPEPILVSEVWRSKDCSSPSQEMYAAVLHGRAELEQWAADRSLVLSIEGGAQISDTNVVIIGLGERPGPGWGFAVSNEAIYRAGTVEIKATFFEPPPAPTYEEESDYCSVIELPKNYEINGVRVRDQYDVLRVWARRPD